ncbi:MAG: SDR family oxidoreductase [Ignavibacteria bacterium]|jgi:NAD(P)-dependent dehydrogenase (short-subunit alcohol dehydrogenase family)|nr:SDR family oxidoreductase [Ignavibacteria bacterium]
MKRKIGLVTGGARRLGRDICLELGRSGFDIILTYNSSSKSILEKTVCEIEETGATVTAYKCDLSKVKNIKDLYKKIKIRFNRIDLLVNNAAIFERAEFTETTEIFFDKFIDTNLKSVFFSSQEAAKIMLENKKQTGRIINIASLGAVENWTGYIPYSLAKSGVHKLTQQLGKKLAPYILVNAIAPGTVLIENDENKTVDVKERERYPMKRFAVSKDITSLVKYLALENKYITGQMIIVDGGRSL